MTNYDRRPRSHRSPQRPAENDRRGVWIGNTRVSGAELASWQLGPDLTQGQETIFAQRRRTSDRH